MKTKCLITAIILLFSANVFSQLIFSTVDDYEDNPVLSPGSAGNWDDAFVIFPCVIEFESTYYMFYQGAPDNDGPYSIGYATSTDGYNFDKQTIVDPLLSGDDSGFDASSVIAPVVIRDSLGHFGGQYVMFYGGLATQGGENKIGLATSNTLTEGWIRQEEPFITNGGVWEWDDFIIYPYSAVQNDTATFLYFSGGDNFYTNWQVGLAKYDGSSWTKYDDPATTEPPFAESDPVLKFGEPGAWDEEFASLPSVNQIDRGYEMIYS